MTLQEYLKEKGLTQAQFAKKIGKSQPTVSRLCNFPQKADKPTKELIKRVTKGKVALK